MIKILILFLPLLVVSACVQTCPTLDKEITDYTACLDACISTYDCNTTFCESNHCLTWVCAEYEEAIFSGNTCSMRCLE